MDRVLEQLRAALAEREVNAMRRQLRPVGEVGKHVTIDGKPLLNLASNDYLGLATHPHLRQAAADAALKHGTGATASRLVTGHLDTHAALEARFAKLKHAEAALLFPTGFMANLAVLTTLARTGDLICLDKLSHASLIDAARASTADVRTYPHLETAKLERLLARHRESHGEEPDAPRRLIVTDSVFSMDGDVADLPTLIALANKHDALLVVDEAHGTGVLGQGGTGLAEAQGAAGQVHITISTASKALAGLGGIVTAPRPVIDTLVNEARAFIYTTGVPPTQIAAIDAALDVVEREPQRRERLAALCAAFRKMLVDRGWVVPTTEPATPIFPLIAGEAPAALALEAHLRERGILAVAIRPPTVPPGSARVRLSLRADLTDDEFAHVMDSVPDGPA